MNISSWQMVFESLKHTEDIIIVEKNLLEEDERDFIIGRIEEIYTKVAYVHYFNADGIWDEEPDRIPYSEITDVTFGNRYITVFSKHVAEYK
jgi:hypothetical protein